MRKSIAALAMLALTHTSSLSWAGGIPTFDSANVAQAITQLLELQGIKGLSADQLREAEKTVTKLEFQIGQLERQFKAISGTRDMGYPSGQPHVKASG